MKIDDAAYILHEVTAHIDKRTEELKERIDESTEIVVEVRWRGRGGTHECPYIRKRIDRADSDPCVHQQHVEMVQEAQSTTLKAQALSSLAMAASFVALVVF